MVLSAGCRAVELTEERTGLPFPALVMYPSSSPERTERFGPYSLDVAMNGELSEGVFPLAVISHGTGGSHLVYRDLAAYLARNGFVVAMPEHPRNNRNNNSDGDTAANLENRPRHIRHAIDWAFSDFGAALKPDSVAVIGHSMGGYTALAIAGGQPSAFAHESPDGVAREIEVEADARVKALVLMAPAAAWYLAPGALRQVRLPILMLTAEHDPHTPEGHGQIIMTGLAEHSAVEHRVIPNAGHFSFLSPFPPSMTNPGFAPSQDPPGFDRAAFHQEMNADILAFLRRTL